MNAETRAPREVRFACQPGCTNCCRARGYVYLTEDDVRRAASFLDLSPKAFEARYVYRTRHLLRLRKPPDNQCPFLVESGCSIHPVKPVQCRVYPFWPELTGSALAWRAEARGCPGIGKGGFVPVDALRGCAVEMRAAYPSMYPVTGGGA